MTKLQPVTIDDLMTATGTGPRQARRLVREGKLPGFMDGTHWVCSPGEWNDWLAGDWESRGVASRKTGDKVERPQRPSFLRSVKDTAA